MTDPTHAPVIDVDIVSDVMCPWCIVGFRQLEQALGAFRRWTDALPNDPNGHYNKGNLLNSMGRPDEAARSFRRAVALAPDFAEAQANLGATLHMTKRYERSPCQRPRSLVSTIESVHSPPASTPR